MLERLHTLQAKANEERQQNGAIRPFAHLGNVDEIECETPRIKCNYKYLHDIVIGLRRL